MGLPLQIICDGRPMEMEKPHFFFSSAAETGFCNFKVKGTLKLDKIPPANTEEIPMNWYYF
jgi:hypothetical protein